MYETLYARDENAKPVPELAEGVKICDGRHDLRVPDPQGRQVPQRQGARRRRTSSPRSSATARSARRPALLSAIDTVEATGPSEVTVKLKEVQSTFLDNLSSPRAPIAIYPAEEAAKDGRQDQLHRHRALPVRRVQARQPREDRAVRRLRAQPEGQQERDGFAGKKEAFIDTVTFRFMPEAGARNAALEAGEVQLNETVDGPTAKRLEATTSASRHLQGAAVRPPGDQVQPCAGAGQRRQFPPRRAGRARHGRDHGDLLSGHLPDGSELALSRRRLPHRRGRDKYNQADLKLRPRRCSRSPATRARS